MFFRNKHLLLRSHNKTVPTTASAPTEQSVFSQTLALLQPNVYGDDKNVKLEPQDAKDGMVDPKLEASSFEHCFLILQNDFTRLKSPTFSVHSCSVLLKLWQC